MNPYSEFPDRVNVCIDIIDTLGGKKDYLYKDPHYTIEDEVWEIAKEYDSMPDFNNIYYGIVFNKLEDLVIEKYPELNFEFFHDVNGYASGTAFNTEDTKMDNWFEIVDEEEFFDTIAKLKFDKLDDCFENRMCLCLLSHTNIHQPKPPLKISRLIRAKPLLSLFFPLTRIQHRRLFYHKNTPKND